MSAQGATAGRIGPNAITRLAEALRERVGPQPTTALFERAGLLRYLLQPPEQMVDEAEVRRLHHLLREAVASSVASEVASDAGRRTADYLLAHRIPRPVQAVLKRLPARLAAAVLLAAIRRHAWTFAGSGRFMARSGHPVVLTIRNNPMCKGLQLPEPGCDYYAAVFERLFRVLVHHQARVAETACEACGDEACRFEIRWSEWA